MSATWILKFPQVDKPKQPILVHVTQKQSTSLDLDLIATDGEEAYKGKVRQRNLSKLQSQNFEGTDEAWAALLRYALVSKQNSDAPTVQTQNLEVDCVISGKGSKEKLSITLRNRIEDITHKLGAIELLYSESTDDVDLFGWACQLADQRDEFEIRAASTTKEAESTQNTIKTLKAQLKNLTKAKEEHEEQLLSKFAALLNEKKLRIRDQQRVLKTAKVDEKKLAEVQLGSRNAQKGKESTKRKRGSDNLQAEDTNEQHDSDGFEPMDVDSNHEEVQDEEDAASGQETPPRVGTPETETASEDEGNVTSARSTTKASTKETKSKAASPPPQPRSLPFQRRDQKADATKETTTKISARMQDDEETESEDDEL